MTMPIQHAQPSPGVDAAVRSQLNRLSGAPPEELNALAGSAPAELSMEAPHEVFTLGLDQLASESGLASASAGGWRYLLQRDNMPVASAQTTVDATGAPVFALFNSGPFVQATADALGRAERIPVSTPGESLEPRLLHVPALHAMALWLHGKEYSDDVVIPLRPAPPPVQPDREYSVDEYLAALREVAATVEPVGHDDTTGG
jgi:hypothetical protein